MSEVKNMKVEIIDDDHIWVNNRQFVSLKRFGDARKEVAREMKLLEEKYEKIVKENEALKVLLKNQLDGVVDDQSTETISNKACRSENDHEWEWVFASTLENRFRCKKCGACKVYPIDYSITTTTSGI
jgi:hypothetical protein